VVRRDDRAVQIGDLMVKWGRSRLSVRRKERRGIQSIQESRGVLIREKGRNMTIIGGGSLRAGNR